MPHFFYCMAEEHDSVWTALCLDLDVAVQAETYDQLVDSMTEAVRLHLSVVAELPADDRARFMTRATPLALRLRYLISLAASVLGGRAGPLPFVVAAAA